MTKRVLLPLFLLLTLFSCQSMGKEKTITVKETANLSFVPDTAKLTFSTSYTSMDVTDAKNIVMERVEKALILLEEEADDYRTT